MWYMWHIEIAYVLNFLKIIFSLFPHVAFKYLNIFFVDSNYLICCAVKMSEEYIDLEEDIEFVPPSGVPPSKILPSGDPVPNPLLLIRFSPLLSAKYPHLTTRWRHRH